MSAGLTPESAFHNECYKQVVIAPFANERVREWPMGYFRRLIELIIGDKQTRVIIVGTQTQRTRANELVRDLSAVRVVNACGRLKWSDVEKLLESACCAITNNSGIGHFAAKCGIWTICIFAASHSWLEWMPRGPRVFLITRMTRCAPCELGGDMCPNEIACMNDLVPEAVYNCFLDIQTQLAEVEFVEQTDSGQTPLRVSN